MKTIIVNVTQHDIDCGQRGQCGRCPIALALNRHAPGNQFFSVGARHAILELDYFDSLETVPLPGVAASFVGQYDARGPVTPFTFEITFQRL